MTSPPPASSELWLTVATQNQNKLREMQHFMESLAPQATGPRIVLTTSPQAQDVEETGSTFLENALIKARAATPEGNSPYIIAEDSGFVIPALSGQFGLELFPGIHSNRWLTSERARQLALHEDKSKDKNEAILKLMAGQSDRSAYYICAMVLYAPAQGLLFEVEGRMPLALIDDDRPRGTGGFGYDPITRPVIDGRIDSRTVAELSATEKNQLSHRGHALRAILEYLRTQHA